MDQTVSVDQLHPKKLPETVRSYNASKVGVDVLDQMARYHTCKSATRRWPVAIFFNIIDCACIYIYIYIIYVRGTAKIAKLGEKLRNVRLRWYGHVKRREEDYVGKRMMEMAVPGRRKRGRPRRRWMDLVREDMERVGAREGDEVDRVKWRLLSRCGDPE